MRIHLSSVYVDDQDKALRFYTEMLGFVKKSEFPVGEYRWLTVVSPDDPDGPELVLEPGAAWPASWTAIATVAGGSQDSGSQDKRAAGGDKRTLNPASPGPLAGIRVGPGQQHRRKVAAA